MSNSKPEKKTHSSQQALFSTLFMAPKPKLKVVRVSALGMWTHLSSFQVPQHSAIIAAWGRKPSSKPVSHSNLTCIMW